MNHLQELNAVQRQAVECTEGPVMIIAGAGSGKTRVLTYRIAYLLHKGIDSFNILSLTFTNKAAREMRERINGIIGGTEAKNLWMGTFHSVFSKILRIEAERIGYPQNFTIYDTEDSKSLIKAILKEFGLDDKVYKPGLVLNRISSAKNSLISWQSYINNPDLTGEDISSGKPKLGEIYKVYVNRCFRASAMDFDDLLFNTNVLLRDHPDVLHKYQRKFKYILVDEYQDTNFSQYVIVKKLAALFQNICVVGDDAQSIYGFRGADIQNILNFEKDYPDLKTFKLEQNYRSTKNIVNAANSIIANNRNQLKKHTWTQNDEGPKIKVVRALNDNEEGSLVANSIFENMMQKQLHNSDFAILYRTNAQSRSMEEALRRLNISYRIYGGLSFYKRKEIKDILAYFSLTINHKDEEALKRIINYPARGIGNATLEKVIVLANERNHSLWDILSCVENENFGFNSGTSGRLSEFVNMIKSFATMLTTHSAYDLGLHISNSSGLLKDLYNDKSTEGVSRYENIQELLNGLKGLSVNYETGEETTKRLADFMADVALFTDQDTEDADDNNKVSLMTIHSAKGLEFKFVHIVGLEENLFPSQLSLYSRSELEEERRLFYVAVTRAEQKVIISYALNRFKWGNLVNCEPSRFIDEIDPSYMERTENKNSDSFNAEKSSLASDFNEEKEWPSTYPSTKKTVTSNYQSTPRLKKIVEATKNQGYSKEHNNAIEKIQTGMRIEHERFGIGEILNIEGNEANKKATIHFNSVGSKQLLLKFAKLKILNQE
jgi:DNA helicase-2/ATP-dependent DNA helicase PcrA